MEEGPYARTPCFEYVERGRGLTCMHAATPRTPGRWCVRTSRGGERLGQGASSACTSSLLSVALEGAAIGHLWEIRGAIQAHAGKVQERPTG